MADTHASLELTKQWVKVVFAILLSFSFSYVFESWFLAIMTFTFLFFVPSADEEVERSFSAAIFTWGMGVLLLFAFFQSTSLGLGLEINLKNTLFGADSAWNTFLGLGIGGLLVGLLLLGLFFRGLMSWAPVRGAEEPSSIKWMVDVGIYFLIVATVIVLQFWTWDNTAIIFTGIWIMAYISGSAGDVESRQTIGPIIIMISFAIFSLGIGTQLVGSGLLGQWFPTVYQGIVTVTGPLGDIFSGFSEGFRNAFQLITNPSGYAQSIINGSYQKDPDTGIAGAFGVELLELKTTPIYAQQPYSAIVKIQNKGAFEARDVKVKLVLGNKSATTGLADVGFVARDKDPIIICPAGGTDCYQNLNMDDKVSTTFTKQDVRQYFFPTKDEGISCSKVVQYDLRTKFLPLKAAVEYKYHVDSNIELEFLSKNEWDRRVREGKFVTQTKKAAQLTNAPVRLNIDTLDQPIREGTGHFLGVNLVSAKKDGKVTKGSISLEIPKKLVSEDIDTKCFPSDRKPDKSEEGNVIKLTWSAEKLKESYLIYCNLPSIDFTKDPKISGPSQTFVIKASADYTFEETKDFTPGKVEFGGVHCCKDASDCPAGEPCGSDKVCGGTVTANPTIQQLDNLITQYTALNAKITEIEQKAGAALAAAETELKTTITSTAQILQTVKQLKDTVDASLRPQFDQPILQIEQALQSARTFCQTHFQNCP